MAAVYFDSGCVEKLGTLAGERLDPNNKEEDFVLFYHGTGGQVRAHLEDSLVDGRLEKGVALCYISAADNAGLPQSEREEFESQYGGYVHILEYGVPKLQNDREPDRRVVARFQRFIDEVVRMVDLVSPPPWWLLYAARPEELVAIYLLDLAECRFREGHDEWKPAEEWTRLRKALDEAAEKQFCELGEFGDAASAEMAWRDQGERMTRTREILRNIFAS